MQDNYDPTRVPYQPQECGTAMNEAVERLAVVVGCDPATFVGRSLQDVFEEAERAYDVLPEFWRVWKEWHAPQPRPEMGDL